jgi:hypothetical protein
MPNFESKLCSNEAPMGNISSINQLIEAGLLDYDKMDRTPSIQPKIWNHVSPPGSR